ncbi:MAG: YjbQ family protein [Candidatus Hydrogenedentota bacterium]|nr:MAG: YjbQ family protein [Candidatus Hydrogenedentota bacterium]
MLTKTLSISTKGNAQVLDITSEVERVVSESRLEEGTVTVFVPGSTAGVTTIEFEPGCCRDLADLFERIAPEDVDYEHHRRWGDGNGHSHVRAALLGASLAIPFVKRKLCLGTWQQIVLVDFDNRPRRRSVVIQAR